MEHRKVARFIHGNSTHLRLPYQQVGQNLNNTEKSKWECSTHNLDHESVQGRTPQANPGSTWGETGETNPLSTGWWLNVSTHFKKCATVKIGNHSPRDRDDNKEIFELPPPRLSMIRLGITGISFCIRSGSVRKLPQELDRECHAGFCSSKDFVRNHVVSRHTWILQSGVPFFAPPKKTCKYQISLGLTKGAPTCIAKPSDDWKTHDGSMGRRIYLI